MSPGNRIRSLVRSIPEGKVVTYGDVSMAVYGRSNCAQAVGSALRIEGDHYPWWRVVNKGGWLPAIPAGFDQVQIQRLKKEGVAVAGGRVDLERHRAA